MEHQSVQPKIKKIVIITVPVAIVIGVIIILALNGVFLKKSDKVLRAIYETCKEKNITDTFSGDSISYTADIELESKDTVASIELLSTPTEKELHLSTGVHGLRVEGTALLTQEELKLQTPLLSDRLFVYDYHKENTGYFVQLLEDQGIDVDQWNQALAAAVEDKVTTEKSGEAASLFVKIFRNLSFEKGEDKKQYVDGSRQNCTVYRAMVTPDDVDSFLDGMEEIYGSTFRDKCNALLNSVGTDYDAWREKLSGQGNRYLNFYLYKNRLVVAELQDETDTISELGFTEDNLFTMNIDALKWNNISYTADIEFTQGADIRELSGEEIDIGNADGEDIVNLLYSSIFDLF